MNNSPVNYIDLSGHVTGNPCEILGRCSKEYQKKIWKDSDKQIINPPYRPKIKNTESEAVITNSIVQNNSTSEPSESTSTSSESASDSWVPDVVRDFLGDARVPIAMDAIQVITGRIIAVSLAAALVPGAGEVALGIFATAYFINRIAATIGFASTAYQAGENLNGTRKVDVVVSGVIWAGGFIFPEASEEFAIFALIYDSINYISSS